MDNKHICNTTETSSEGISNNFTEPNVSHTTINTETDSASIAVKSIDNKNKEQGDEIRKELASTSYEKDANGPESNLQELKDTKLVDDKIGSMHTSSPSTALPIMKILSPTSRLHRCLECCSRCKRAFLELDSPLHICRIQSIDKQNELLKIEPSLCVDSCLCDLCWKDLERIYKFNKLQNLKEESYSDKKCRLLERFVKNNVPTILNQARQCSIHLCSRPYCHKMSVNDCENIKKLYLTFEFCHFVFVQSKKQTSDILEFPFCLCETHNAMILVMSSCQICGDKLNAPFNTDDWSMHKMWNCVLRKMHLPLTLEPGMFICVTCKGHISKKEPSFPEFSRVMSYIRMSNTVRFQLYGVPQFFMSFECQKSRYVSPPIVVPESREEKKFVRSTKVKFSDPLITAHICYETGYYKDDTESITSTALLNVAEQNLCTPKLKPSDEGLDFVNLEEEYLNTFIPNKGIEVDRSSMNLKEGNQCINKINTIRGAVYLNQTDNSSYSFTTAVQQPNVIKRKQSNVICDTISNKDLKKQMLNENYSSSENNSTDENTTISYRNLNTANTSINSPSFFNMTSNCNDDYDSKSDISDSISLDSEEFSDSDIEEMSPVKEVKETDYIIVTSNNFDLDSD